VNHEPGSPGSGGCASASDTNGCGRNPASSLGGKGAAGVSDQAFAAGGGGGAHYPYGGNGGGAASPLPYPVPVGGGGGGGSQSYTANGSSFVQLASDSSNGEDGFVSIFRGGRTDTAKCSYQSSQQTYTVPSGVRTVLGIAAGASSGNASDPEENGAPRSASELAACEPALETGASRAIDEFDAHPAGHAEIRIAHGLLVVPAAEL
jgi:hypothetical protein